jgi:hypothetical protein
MGRAILRRKRSPRDWKAPVLIDNTPKVTGLTAARGVAARKWHGADVKQYRQPVLARWRLKVATVTRLSDAPELDYELNLDASRWRPSPSG